MSWQTIKFNSKKNLETKIIEYYIKPRSRQEIVDYMDLSYFYVINELLKGLIEKGKIIMTISEKQKSAKQKYVSEI